MNGSAIVSKNSLILYKTILIKIRQLEILNSKNVNETDLRKIEGLSEREEKLVSTVEQKKEPTKHTDTLLAYYQLLEKKYLKKLESIQNKTRSDFMKR